MTPLSESRACGSYACGLALAVLLTLLAATGCASSSETAETAAADTTAPPPVPTTVPAEPSRPRADAGVNLDTVRAGRFDDGKMWTFDSPPLDYFQEEYGLDLSAEWFERARLGALRIPGCTASFTSPRGLMLTNHHCGRSHAVKVGRDGEAILDEGFYADQLDAERRVEGLYADQLVQITDVTDEVDAAMAGAQTDAERADARTQATEQIQQRLVRQAGGAQRGYRAEVIPLYDGAQYSAYTFKRYEDVRLVMIPELAIGYFGGDPDNFTYPRYTLDMAVFRAYENGRPLQTEHFFPLDPDGSQPGDPVFVVGNPGSTSRLETVEQLEFRRDVQDQTLLDFLKRRVEVLKEFEEAQPQAAEARDVRNQIFSLQNAIKLYTGRLKALSDPVIMARRADRQEQFAQAIQDDSGLAAEYGGLVDSMAALQQERRQTADAYGAFRLLTNPSYASATLRRALVAYQLLQRQEAGTSGEQLADLREQLAGIADQPDALDERFLAARMEDFQTYFGENDAITQAALEGRTPQDAAAAIAEASVLSDSARTAEAVAAGTLSMDDPAVQLAGSFYETYQDYQSATAGLGARQERFAKELGQARFAVYGTDVPPDASFSLRIADGRVEGYPYNGTYAAPYTTLFGLYNHYYAYGQAADSTAGSPWDLPERWLGAQGRVDRATPLNLVSTNDITGGNSGSPLLNEDLEIVGLIFDGNIESLASDFIYLPERVRAVSVDSRGMLEALRSVYEAERLVQEMTSGEMAASDVAVR